MAAITPAALDGTDTEAWGAGSTPSSGSEARQPTPTGIAAPVGLRSLRKVGDPSEALTERGRPRGRLLLLHGLGGSIRSRYMLRMALEAHRRGWEVARLGFRGAEQDGLGRSGFHNAQRTEDVRAALDAIPWSEPARKTRLAAVGFSLGGAILLRYLGERGAGAGIDAAAAVAPPIDLSACLAELERPRNRVYHAYYVHRLRRQIRTRARAHPGRLPPLTRSMRSVRRLDEVYVAPDAGYPSAEAYYEGASARPSMRDIATPCLIIASEDDPFVPIELFADLPASPVRPEILSTRRGGHVGYLTRREGRLRLWAGERILDWLESADERRPVI